MESTLGLYLSIPFCRGKCTFCNFASDTFDQGLLPGYVEAVCAEIQDAPARAERLEVELPRVVDTVYLGGGTPSLLAPAQVRSLFAALRSTFRLASDAEITVECAPGQLAPATLLAMQGEGVNRMSFGVQSFVDQEAAAVGRQHTGAQCRQEIERVLHAGVRQVGVDLIAGLPHQSRTSWRVSLDELLCSGADHASVYLLELDGDSRLGREVLGGGQRYAASSVPDEDLTADLYEDACAAFESSGLQQYEISNFSRAGAQSRHNLKYWNRNPYLGFGLDAHSMLRSKDGAALRFANTDELSAYMMPSAARPAGLPSDLVVIPRTSSEQERPHLLSVREVCEETLFLGLRTNAGLDLRQLASEARANQLEFEQTLRELLPVLDEAWEQGLLLRDLDRIWLTPRGRLLSNELFSRLLLHPAA